MIAVALALKDVRHDLRNFLGLTIALAAVLGPLMVLLALKTGVTTALLDDLRSDPAVLEITFQGDRSIPPPLLAEIAAMDTVGFVAPLARQITETIELEGPAGTVEPATPRSSGPGDPLLGQLAPPDARQIVLSQRLANQLQAAAGDRVTAILTNRKSGAEFDLPLTVLGIAPDLRGRFVLSHPDLPFFAQAVAGGLAVPELDIPGTEPRAEERDVTRLRLYAKDLRSVAPLEAALTQRGFFVRSERQRIAGILRLEQNLNAILWVIAGFAGGGYVLSLAVNLWSSVQRKRKSLAMLRLMGLRTNQMMLFPVVQGLAAAMMCFGFALVLCLTAGAVLNASFDGSLPGGQRVASLRAVDALTLLAATLLASALAAGWSGLAIANLDPKEALRAE